MISFGILLYLYLLLIEFCCLVNFTSYSLINCAENIQIKRMYTNFLCFKLPHLYRTIVAMKLRNQNFIIDTISEVENFLRLKSRDHNNKYLAIPLIFRTKAKKKSSRIKTPKINYSY